MKYQGIIITIIACAGLIVAVVINNNIQYNNQIKRDAEFQKLENQRRGNIQKCMQLGIELIQKDACAHYNMPAPCVLPNDAITGVNTATKYLDSYCQNTYGKQ